MKIPTVTINKRKLKDRRVSIYLSYRPAITDPITKKDHAFETLGVYLWDKPRNDIEKEFMKDLKPVYGAVTKDAGEMALDKLEEKWGEQYPIVIKSWRDNWERLSEFFQYSELIRKLIYTTNTVEGYHRQIRKVTKNKGIFPNDTALIKLVYLAYRNARKKWTMPVPNWGIISQQLAIKFEDRYNLL